MGDSATGRSSFFAMTPPRFPLGRLLILFICVYLWSCSPAPTPTPFIPPTVPPPLIEPTLIIQPTRQVVIIQPTPLPTVISGTPTPTPEECTNDLTFIADVTVPDNTFYDVGAIIDKQWLVENSGTCNWDSRYILKHISGDDLGAPAFIALYPARAGTQATLQITFTAPFIEGAYQSEWRAFDKDGIPFGDPVFIKIIVQSGG